MRTSASPPGPGDEAQRGSVGLNGTYWASRSQRHRTAATLTFRASWDTGPGPSSITAGGSAASISSEGSPCNEPNPVRAGGGQQAVPGRAPIPTPPLPPLAAHHQPVPPPGSAAPWPCRAPRCPGSWRGAAGQRRCAAAGGEVGRPRWRSDVLMKVSGPRAVHKGEPEPGPCRAGGGSVHPKPAPGCPVRSSGHRRAQSGALRGAIGYGGRRFSALFVSFLRGSMKEPQNAPNAAARRAEGSSGGAVEADTTSAPPAHARYGREAPPS